MSGIRVHFHSPDYLMETKDAIAVERAVSTTPSFGHDRRRARGLDNSLVRPRRRRGRGRRRRGRRSSPRRRGRRRRGRRRRGLPHADDSSFGIDRMNQNVRVVSAGVKGGRAIFNFETPLQKQGDHRHCLLHIRRRQPTTIRSCGVERERRVLTTMGLGVSVIFSWFKQR